MIAYTYIHICYIGKYNEQNKTNFSQSYERIL